MSIELADRQYYEVAKPLSFAERVVVAARDRIYRDLLDTCQPSAKTRILDVGVSDVINDAANVLERKLSFPENITAVGLGEGSDFRAEFPKVRYTQIVAGAPLPFADDSFDIATSNAVLEHVGSHDQQLRFVAEHVRVAKLVFITVPHRYFPVEHHTGFPLLHYADGTFKIACRATGKEKWAQPETLIMMDWQRLKSLVPAGRSSRIFYTGLKMGPFSSNLALVIDRRTEALA